MKRRTKKKTTGSLLPDAEIHKLLDCAIRLVAQRVNEKKMQPSISDLARLLEIRKGLTDRNPARETIITWQEERPRKQPSRQDVNAEKTNVD